MILEIEKERAKRRQEATQAQAGEKVGARKAVESVPPPKQEQGKSRDKTGEKTGVSGKTAQGS